MSCRRSTVQPKTAAKLLAIVGAALVLAAAAYLARRSGRSDDPSARSASAPRGPQDCVAAMILAEKQGRVTDYLDCFAGPLRERLTSRLMSKPAGERSRQLQGSVADLTGQATTELNFSGGDSATLVLERIFTDKNERQQISLRRISHAWKITGIEPLETYAPEIPYGTPVYSGGGGNKNGQPSSAGRQNDNRP